MKRIESIIRATNPWYNMENIYCLLRLIQEIEVKDEPFTYSELDAFQETILGDVELDMKNVVPLKMHLNHLEDSIIFNSSEDFYLIKEAHEMGALLDATPEETLEYARLFAEEFKESAFEIDLYMLYSDIKKLIQEIEESEGVQPEQKPTVNQSERVSARH